MIKIRGLTKKYKSNIIFSNVSLNLTERCVHFLMGKNGSGKTTFVKCLLDLENYLGEITFDGNTLREISNTVFPIFDDVPLYNELSGIKNIRLMVDNNKTWRTEDICDFDLLSSHKLNQKVKNYSLGERKKLLIICAMLNKPKYLVLDEVSNGLDIEALDILKKHLIDLKQAVTIVATGHHFEFYGSIVDNLLLVKNGAIEIIDKNDKGDDTLYETYKRHFSCN